MKSRWPWKRVMIIAASLLMMASASLLAYLRHGRDPKNNVQTGKLGYTSEAGWINWSHANQEGIVRFLDAFRNAWHAAEGKPFHVSYAQRMNDTYGGIRVESIVEREYQIDSC